jgi:hypothetical protein
VRALRENIEPLSCCIDRAIARSIQQDRGWIFKFLVLPEQLRSLSFLLYSIVRFQKWGKRSCEVKLQSPKHLQNKTIVKNVLLVGKTTLQHFLYRILTQFR